MKLVYKEGPKKGQEVKVDDRLQLTNEGWVYICHFEKPHKPEASGYVYYSKKKAGSVGTTDLGWSRCYVTVFGMEWIDREDRLPAEPVVEHLTATERDRVLYFRTVDVGIQRRARVIIDGGALKSYSEQDVENAEFQDFFEDFFGGPVQVLDAKGKVARAANLQRARAKRRTA